VWITAFNAFGGMDENPSSLVLARLAALRPELRTVVLPTEFDAGRARLLELPAQGLEALVMLGFDQTARAVKLEYLAQNRVHARMPDNAGLCPRDAEVVPGGPAHYASTLPLERWYDLLRRAGVPVVRSDDAGTFVCNHVFYTALHRGAAQAPDTPMGFIHLPPFAALGMEAQVQALCLLIDDGADLL